MLSNMVGDTGVALLLYALEVWSEKSNAWQSNKRLNGCLMYSASYRVVLAIGWITFITSVSSPLLHRLEWRYEMIVLFLGPVLMFAGLIMRYRTEARRRGDRRGPTDKPSSTNSEV